ncbi:hypothetical protein ACHAWC_009815 [Mediolabrus comicus]
MPTIAGTAKEKRLFSELFNDGDTKSKKQRVRFDDVVEVLTEEDSDDDEDVGDEFDRQDSEDEDVDFILSIGEDGDIDYTIITSSCHSRDHPTSQEDNNKESSPKQHYLHDKIVRPASPFAGSDRQLCEELYMSFSSFHEGMTSTSGSDFNCFTSPSRSSACWSSSLGNNLKILIPNSTKGNSHEDDNIGGRKVSFDSKVGARSPPSPPYGDDESVMLTPLITPPSSPRRVVCNISSENGKVTEEEAVICEWPCNLTVDNAITSALELSLP